MEEEAVADFNLDDFDSEDVETELFNPLHNVGARLRNISVTSGHTDQHNMTTSWLSILNTLPVSEVGSVFQKPVKQMLPFGIDHLPNFSGTDMISCIKNTPNNQLNPGLGKCNNGPFELSIKPNIRTHTWDRSNNALPTSQVESSVTISDGTRTASVSSNVSTSHSFTLTFHPDGDNSHTSEPGEFGVLSLNTAIDGFDSYTEEYLAASIDLRERRSARLARQMRMRERIESMRMRMREADMERKRWLPVRLLQYLRRFYAESGYVRSTTGAVISSVLIIAVVSFVQLLHLLVVHFILTSEFVYH
ncbi:unnamed protein product [Heterobilharzia americana]|nr:unnamed protein product [Heterobilharzia americana]